MTKPEAESKVKHSSKLRSYRKNLEIHLEPILNFLVIIINCPIKYFNQDWISSAIACTEIDFLVSPFWAQMEDNV